VKHGSIKITDTRSVRRNISPTVIINNIYTDESVTWQTRKWDSFKLYHIHRSRYHNKDQSKANANEIDRDFTFFHYSCIAKHIGARDLDMIKKKMSWVRSVRQRIRRVSILNLKWNTVVQKGFTSYESIGLKTIINLVLARWIKLDCRARSPAILIVNATSSDLKALWSMFWSPTRTLLIVTKSVSAM